MNVRLRSATLADLPIVLPRVRALNAHESIEVTDEVLESALRKLLADPSLGSVWLIEDHAVIGYACVTYGYDLEFGGRDAGLTEFWIDESARGHGAGAAALDALEPELRARGVGALHLQVRPENPALRLYERTGFKPSGRIFMTRRY
jgi:ribosomal protein S18 acetylase RimI-like enzyme